jgi:hypothetical protein
MDHIEQDRAAARLFAPGEGTIVVAIWLIERRAAHHGDELAKDSRLDDLDRLLQNRAMAAMVSHQQLRVGAFRGLNEARGFLKRMADRFFDQRRNACGDALKALLDVHLVGSREHNAIGRMAGETFRQRPVHGHVFPLSNFDRLWRGVDDRRKDGAPALLNFLNMADAD